MDEQPRRYWYWLALVLVPPALVVMLPVVVLLGLSFYVRAMGSALASLIRFLWRYSTPRVRARPAPAPLLAEVGAGPGKIQE